MATPQGELRLGLSGRSLIFPDGAAFCLVCGRRPFGTRAQAFRDADYAERRTEVANLLLKRVHPLLAWVNRARLVTFKIDAPLCFRHYWKGRGFDVAVIVVFVLATAGLLALGLKGKLPSGPSEVGSLLKGLLIALVLIPGFLFWRRGRRPPILPCDARRESPERVVLTYGADPPRKP
jgi:hypothetical protein